MDASIIAIAFQDRLSKMEQGMKKMEAHIHALEKEIIALKEGPKIETTLDNLMKRGINFPCSERG